MLFEKIQLEEGEKIVTLVRKHWFFLAKKISGVCFMIILPLIGYLLLKTTFDELSFDLDISIYTSYLTFLYALWILINWMVLAYAWTDYYLDVWTVTDRRIIKIDQMGFFNRQIGSFRLEKLQDMNIEIKGIIATFLNFGTIEAQTASGSHQDEFRASHLPKPRELKSIILKAADERMRERKNIGNGEL